MKIDIEPADLRPLVQQVVQEALVQMEADNARLNGRLGYTESEAAALLGIRPHALRDCRLRGEVAAAKIGKRVIYRPEDLAALLAANRIG